MDRASPSAVRSAAAVADLPTFFQTTAIDYPNSRPHIGTAFEKIGADVQARYRRMEGFDVFFLMGNDENTNKVANEAAKQGRDVQEYCNDMARQFREVWDALEISYDAFIQTSHDRHKRCCQKFIQKVYDNGYIYKGQFEGWYCDGCEQFKTDQDYENDGGICPNHKAGYTRRSEPCYFFKLSAFQERLLDHFERNPDFIEPESRRNEIVRLVKLEGLKDINISRLRQKWGIPIPFDPEFVIYVWFDALLTYITGIGYGDDEATFRKYWPADIHFIGKDITRFHCALWPAMLWAAGEEAPKKVFGHGFVYFEGGKISKSRAEELKKRGLDYLLEPMDIVKRFSGEAFRYYFMRECPFPGDGDFSPDRFIEVYNSELANNLGNTYSRVVRLVSQNYDNHLGDATAAEPGAIYTDTDLETTVKQVQNHVEACQYNQALQRIVLQILDPTNQYMEKTKPWMLVKTDKKAAKAVLFDAAEQLRVVSILLKPFLPRSAEVIYRSFNFAQPWAKVRYADAWDHPRETKDLRLVATLEGGKAKPLFPRINV
jgi:methionyl-tRNA synthetase